ncbi:FprA family A-type flavoprotein [Novosphingobium mangrovi (ex Huang et al. 2023)]|uniref:FprA family A-type flavoprotein n=1 Tax=Novosphingobium mangrovi (ex Huang et al. 2023) TaxID=2976432 RepID=A0ABT2I9I1_9SPHN|nr:FprA family A-type flavoprotein [Novosphingobium mangrovi (ex Huang et al. 2023)]MCT2401492.1 FprA family A-type flavoprotein [Novosphingobium mangrovi (ex Huang et al. 2023)]
MTVTNSKTGTNISAITDGIWRINTPVALEGGMAFSFNQYLVEAERPLLFHTGPRQIFEVVREAVEHVMPCARVRYIGFCHMEADECGSLNEWLACAPDAVPLCSAIGAMTSVGDMADRPPQVIPDGETLDLGGRTVQWFDAPHVPHGWDNGFLFETVTGTLMCGDLFTQPGEGTEALTETDILTPSEAFRQAMDYYAHGPETGPTLARLAAAEPKVLACMHGSAWRGDGGGLLRRLAGSLAGQP